MAVSTDDLDYPLDPALIAQSPPARRDQSRLMVLRRKDGRVAHHVFAALPELLGPDDLLVLNDTQVIPAKFAARRASGGRIDGLFCLEVFPGRWEVLLRNARWCAPGEKLTLEGPRPVVMKLLERQGAGRWAVQVDPPESAVAILQAAGTTPLPPYIRRPGPLADPEDRRRYQTVYAARPGAVAAPTAGLHFTTGLLDSLKAKGVELAEVTLHVGPGTFAPVKAKSPAGHKMHAEYFEVSAQAAEKLNAARRQGRRIVAVGTTSARVLETVAREAKDFAPRSGWTDLFIYPPAEFHAVDALITNFHLPKSTLLMLVAAFCSPGTTDGVGVILRAYGQAIRLRYRFYSYGDAMLIE